MADTVFSPENLKVSPIVRLRLLDLMISSWSYLQVHSLIAAGLWQLLIALMKKNWYRQSTFLLGRLKRHAHPTVGRLMSPTRAVCVGECSNELYIWALLLDSWHWIQKESWKSRPGCDGAQMRGPAIPEMQGLWAKCLRTSRCGKKYKPKWENKDKYMPGMVMQVKQV